MEIRNMEKLLSGFGKINANAIWSLIAVAFSGAIIAGLAFIGIRMMMHAQDDLTIHRTIGYISNQETYRIIGMISGGSVCLGWSLFLAIRVITVVAGWFNAAEKRGFLPSLVIRNLYPLFAFAGMVFLALVAYSCSPIGCERSKIIPAKRWCHIAKPSNRADLN